MSYAAVPEADWETAETASAAIRPRQSIVGHDKQTDDIHVRLIGSWLTSAFFEADSSVRPCRLVVAVAVLVMFGCTFLTLVGYVSFHAGVAEGCAAASDPASATAAHACRPSSFSEGLWVACANASTFLPALDPAWLSIWCDDVYAPELGSPTELRSVFVPWEPACLHHSVYVSAAEARSLLADRRLLFAGDSTMQEMLFELISWLEGTRPGVEIASALPMWNVLRPPCADGWYSSRSVDTSLFPTPALSLYNTSMAFVYNGHVSECGNFGGLDTLLQPALWEKLDEHAALCINRTAHLDYLSRTLPSAASTLTEHSADDSDGTARREASLSTIKATDDPTLGFQKTLLDAGRTLYAVNVSDRRTGMWQPCNQGRASYDSSSVDGVLPYDVVVYNAGLHLDQRQPLYPSFAERTQYIAAINTTMSRLARFAPLVVWKDTMNVHEHPALRDYNRISLRLAEQHPSVVSWPVERMLDRLSKSDPRHCSFKLREKTDSQIVRTVFCHQAVQVLLLTIKQHIQQQQQQPHTTKASTVANMRSTTSSRL